MKRLFSDRPEDSLRLRVLILLTVLWVALSLNWLTGSPWVPLGASACAAAGHWTSWRKRHSPLGYRSPIIVLLIVALSVVTRDSFVSALTGDRLPIAEYLLLICGISSFGLKTRGGLYAQLALSGIILFFVSERAFDQTFVGFLIVFLGLFLTFNAMTFLEDQLRIARVHWPEGQLGRFWFWLGIVGGGLLVCSALAFSLLPSDYRGRPGAQRVGIVPFMGEGMSEADQFAAGQDPLGPGVEPDTPGAERVIDAPGLSGDSLAEFGAATDESFGSRQAPVDPRDVVMHVRSGVTSYWRGRIFDVFDGQTWYRSGASVVSRSQRDRRDYYWQAYFMEQDQPGSLFVGYTPVTVLLSPDLRVRQSLVEGSTYSVLSQQPALSASDVRRDITARTSGQYLSVPPSTEGIHDLAREIVQDATTPFEQLWLIVSYLRQHHTFDVLAPNQLTLSGDTNDFLTGDRPGTSLDFASATVLLARATGLPARVAVGYLPGRFDPFSGTHKVRQRDAHAWAEVAFARNGWVAFDATPRPELEVFASGNLAPFGSTSFIFQTRVGGGLYSLMRSGASEATSRIAGAIEGNEGILTKIAVAVVVLSLGALAFWLLHRRSRKPKDAWTYSRLSGEGREDVLRTYRRLERFLRRNGFEPRERSQTLGEYSAEAGERFGHLARELDWMKRAAWTAAYNPAWPGPGLATEAVERLARIRRSRGSQDNTE